MRFQVVVEAHSKATDDFNRPEMLLVMRQYHSSLNILLADYAEHGCMKKMEKLLLVQSLAGTMRKFHSRGQFVHCDVKPGNILVYDTVAENGRDTGESRFKTKFCDFEFSIRENEKTGTPFGSSDFWAHPKQLTCDSVSHVRYDLWALALVLYEVFYFRKRTPADNELAPLFFNDAFTGTLDEKIARIENLITSVCYVDPVVPPECIPFPPHTNPLLRDLMLRLMSGTLPTWDKVRDHLLLVPPQALQDGLVALRADAEIQSGLEGDEKPYFKSFPEDIFSDFNAAVRLLKPHHVDKKRTDPCNLREGVRLMRNLIVHPTKDFNISWLYFRAPQFLLDLGVKLTELKIRIKQNGAVEKEQASAQNGAPEQYEASVAAAA